MNKPFPNRTRERQIPWRGFLMLIALLFLVASVLVPIQGGPGPGARDIIKAKKGVTEIRTALHYYQEEYQTKPAGNHTEIISALREANPRNLAILDRPRDALNARGEYLDPWGTPYRIDISDPNSPRIWSCGKDRKDDNGAPDSDDIPSWR